MAFAQSVQDYATATAYVPSVKKVGRSARRRTVCKGTQIFDASAPFARAYIVVSGEVLILRDGKPVDIVEAGELLDPRIWHDATAIANTDSTLASPRVGV